MEDYGLFIDLKSRLDAKYTKCFKNHIKKLTMMIHVS